MYLCGFAVWKQPGYVRRGNKGIVDVRSRLNDGMVLEEGIGRSKGLGCAAITIQSELMEMVNRMCVGSCLLSWSGRPHRQRAARLRFGE